MICSPGGDGERRGRQPVLLPQGPLTAQWLRSTRQEGTGCPSKQILFAAKTNPAVSVPQIQFFVSSGYLGDQQGKIWLKNRPCDNDASPKYKIRLWPKRRG